MATPKTGNPSGRPARHEGPFAAVTVTLPVKILGRIERDRADMEATGEKDPGRSGMIATILTDHYAKDLQGAA